MGTELLLMSFLLALGADEEECPGETDRRNTMSVAITASIEAGDLRRYDADISFVRVEHGALHVRRKNQGSAEYLWLEGEPWLIGQTYEHFCKNKGGPDNVPIKFTELCISTSQCPGLSAAVAEALSQLNASFDVLDVLEAGGVPEREPIGLIQVDGPSYRVHVRTREGNASVDPRDSSLYTSVGHIFDVLKGCRDALVPNKVIESDF